MPDNIYKETIMETKTEKIITRIREQGYSLKVLEHEPVITIDDVIYVLKIPIDEMAKTLLLSHKEIGLIALVLSGTNRVDYAKVARILHVPRKTVQMANRDTLKNLGLSPGDMCPFHEFFQKIIVDITLLKQLTVYCGSGDPRKTIIIDPKDIVKVTGATVADISHHKKKEVQDE